MKKTRFLFKTRNYKHEVNMATVHTYTRDYWEQLVSEAARLGFNGIVLYCGYHPFEDLLDFKPFPGAAEHTAAVRRKNRASLNTGLALAKQYGLRTFIQHYVGHFTGKFAKKDGHPFYPPGTSRVSGIDTPGVRKYNRYCYKEIFKVCPDLTGLYFNFESLNNGMEFVIDTALKQFNSMKKKPVAVYRLWDMSNPELVKKAVRFYRGETILGHKIMDTSDAYYYPRADSRVAEWKKLLPRTEFMFLVGPCHNCGTNICGGLWNDSEFTYALLDDARKKGADSISFHSAPCLLTGNFPRSKATLPRANYFHLQTVVDYMQGLPLDRKRLAELHARHFKVDRPAGRLLMEAIQDSSQIILNIYQQFICNSADIGYTVPGRFTPVQEPFFFLPSTYFNNELKDNVPMGVSWLRKSRDVKVVDRDLQPIIDLVDPSRPAAKDNPRVIAERIRKAAESSMRKYKAARKRAPGKNSQLAALEIHLDINYKFGMRVFHEVMAAICMYAGYFSKTKAAFLKTWDQGMGHFEAISKYYKGGARPADRSISRMLLMSNFDIKLPLKAARSVRRAAGKPDFPFKSFQAYMRSRREYNEIRRTVRPWRFYEKAVTAATIETQLRASLRAADEALRLLPASAARTFGKQVRAWRDNVALELERLDVPSVGCGDGRSQYLYYDQCFRYGMFFWDDFAGFVKPQIYSALDDVRFTVDRDRRNLIIRASEKGCDMTARRAQYTKWDGAHDLSGFVRIFIDPSGKGGRFTNYSILALGKGAVVSVFEKKNDRELHRSILKIEKELDIAFKAHETDWEMTVKIPFRLLGKTPKQGETWGFNIAANTAVASLRALVWSASWEMGAGHPERLGKLVF